MVVELTSALRVAEVSSMPGPSSVTTTFCRWSPIFKLMFRVSTFPTTSVTFDWMLVANPSAVMLTSQLPGSRLTAE